MCLICGPADNMARSMPAKITMLFWKGALQVVVEATKPRSSLNSKASLYSFNVYLTSITLLYMIFGLRHHSHLLGFLNQEREWWPHVFGDHDYKQHKKLEVMVKGGCVGTEACFTVRGWGAVLSTCQVPFAPWENASCLSFLIVTLQTNRNLGYRSLRILGGTARGRCWLHCLVLFLEEKDGSLLG